MTDPLSDRNLVEDDPELTEEELASRQQFAEEDGKDLEEDEMELSKDTMNLVEEFQCLPTRYVHASWIEEVPHRDLVKKLQGIEVSEPFVSQYILETFELSRDDFFDPDDELSLLAATTDADQWRKIIRSCGAVMNSSQLKTIVDGIRQKKIRQELGSDLFGFAISRASFLTRHFFGHLYPPYDDWQNFVQFTQYLDFCGVRCLGQAYGAIPREVCQRLLFRLPKELSPHFIYGQEDADEEKSRQAALLIYKLYKEVT